jgi:hypothetical protein
LKVEVKLSLEGDMFFAVGQFARKENIDEKQAIRWLINEGLKSFNGGNPQTKLPGAGLHGETRKEE